MQRTKRLSNILAAAAIACGTPASPDDGGTEEEIDARIVRRDGSTPRPDGGSPGPVSDSIEVELVPNEDGPARVSFAVPFGPGWLDDPAQLTVEDSSGAPIDAGFRSLALHGDGSQRSVLVQFELTLEGETTVTVSLHETPGGGGGLEIEPVASTLDGDGLPRVWAVLPAAWLSASGFAGRLVPNEGLSAPLSAWGDLCDYAEFADTEELDNNTWLYDRGTVYARGYARTGDVVVLRAAYRALELYRSRITGTGTETRIGIGTVGDVKYNYAQNMAYAYLLTGDERFRDAAVNVAIRMHELHSPGYEAGDGFWTERNQGFSLLAYVHAMTVAEDPSSLRAWAEEVVDASLSVQERYPEGYTDTEARCFAHDCEAHDPEECEDNDTHYWGCSPWMSSILAEGLDTFAREVPGERADRIAVSLEQLARILARDAIVPETDGRPYYWMGVGPGAGDGWDEGYEEHRGEVVYVVALGALLSGDADLRASAMDLARGFAEHGEVPHVRSFNWQCRSAVQTPAILGGP